GDVAQIALAGRRDVGVAPVEVEAVHAGALARGTAHLPVRDVTGLRRVGYVVDAHTAAKARGVRFASGGTGAQYLAIGDHDAVAHAHLVRMRADRHLDRRKLFRVLRVRHVHDHRAVRIAHVADVGNAFLHHDLSAARAVEPRHGLHVGARRAVRMPRAPALADVHVADFAYAF